MNTHPRSLIAILVILAGSAFSGCATIIKGTTQVVPVSSDPSGARVTVNGLSAGTTPTSLTLSRKQDHLVIIEKEGYNPEVIAVTKSLGGAVAGNLLAGGFVGWGVDAVTGAQYNLHPTTLHVRLSNAADQTGTIAAASKNRAFIDELARLDERLTARTVTPEEYMRLRAEIVERFQK